VAAVPIASQTKLKKQKFSMANTYYTGCSVYDEVNVLRKRAGGRHVGENLPNLLTAALQCHIIKFLHKICVRAADLYLIKHAVFFSL
jgi:hypothetical protein